MKTNQIATGVGGLAAGGLRMPGQRVRVTIRVLVGLVLGAVSGALYATLVAAVHLGVYRRWDHLPGFAADCVLVGAVLGLLGGIACALSCEAATGRPGNPRRPRRRGHPGDTRGPEDEAEGRGARRPDRTRHHAPSDGPVVRPGYFPRACRAFDPRKGHTRRWSNCDLSSGT